MFWFPNSCSSIFFNLLSISTMSSNVSKTSTNKTLPFLYCYFSILFSSLFSCLLFFSLLLYSFFFSYSYFFNPILFFFIFSFVFFLLYLSSFLLFLSFFIISSYIFLILLSPLSFSIYSYYYCQLLL